MVSKGTWHAGCNARPPISSILCQPEGRSQHKAAQCPLDVKTKQTPQKPQPNPTLLYIHRKQPISKYCHSAFLSLTMAWGIHNTVLLLITEHFANTEVSNKTRHLRRDKWKGRDVTWASYVCTLRWATKGILNRLWTSELDTGIAWLCFRFSPQTLLISTASNLA